MHNWVAQTSQVLTGYTTVVDQEAYDEPIYSQVERAICNGCGADVTENYHERDTSHGYRIEYVMQQTGSTHHNAVTHEEPVYETVTTYVCSGCGEGQ